MSNPTSGWDLVPVTGKWLNIDGTPKSGKIKFTLSQRVIATDGTAIYPRGGTMSATLGAETGAISTSFPASDDPNISPTGWSIKVEEQLSDGSGQTYFITPSLADLPGGVNLNAVVVPDTAPATPAPVYMRGQPGGIAALDADGKVLDGDGNVITGGGATDLADLADVNVASPTDGQALVWDDGTSKWIPGTVASGSVAWTSVTGKPTFATVATSGLYSDLTDKPTIPDTPDDIGAATAAQGAKADTAVQPGDLATVATTGAYSDLTGKPTIPATAADVGAVPTTRTVNSKALSANITLTASDVGAATTAQGTKADTAVQPGSLADVATSGLYSDLSGKPTIPATAADVGAVPTSRTVNGKALSADITLTPADTGAVEAAAPGVRIWPADTEFPTTGVQVGDLFPYIGEA